MDRCSRLDLDKLESIPASTSPRMRWDDPAVAAAFKASFPEFNHIEVPESYSNNCSIEIVQDDKVDPDFKSEY